VQAHVSEYGGGFSVPTTGRRSPGSAARRRQRHYTAWAVSSIRFFVEFCRRCFDMRWYELDWAELFIPTVPALELILRGTLMYVGIFVVLRVLLRRVSGNVTIADLLMVTLIADAAQNAMASEYRSVTDGAILVLTIIFWNYLLDRLAFHSPWIGRFVYPAPLPLIRDGRLLWHNLRREFISEEELRGQMREQGVADYADVKLAHMEGDGRISIIKRE
jgi:hypothetical protein